MKKFFVSFFLFFCLFCATSPALADMSLYKTFTNCGVNCTGTLQAGAYYFETAGFNSVGDIVSITEKTAAGPTLTYNNMYFLRVNGNQAGGYFNASFVCPSTCSYFITIGVTENLYLYKTESDRKVFMFTIATLGLGTCPAGGPTLLLQYSWNETNTILFRMSAAATGITIIGPTGVYPLTVNLGGVFYSSQVSNFIGQAQALSPTPHENEVYCFNSTAGGISFAWGVERIN